MDFTLKIYKQLLNTLKNAGYTFQTFSEYLTSPAEKCIILRHDVDLLPENSLRFAKIQAEYGIKGSYYFRAVPESWDEEIIKSIAALGHEVGYHYETMDTAKGDVELAHRLFIENLGKLRGLAPVTTICMHGSPRSKHDNRTLWQHYNYRDYGIIGEPYFDVDFSRVLYLTDTGRRWDGYNVSVRDKIPGHQERWEREGLVFHSTKDIIKALPSTPIAIGALRQRKRQRCLSSPINAKRYLSAAKVPLSEHNRCLSVAEGMFTFHPQRWHPFGIAWLKELVLQRVKNVVKRFKVRRSS